MSLSKKIILLFISFLLIVLISVFSFDYKTFLSSNNLVSFDEKTNLEEKNMIKENFDITDHDIASSIDEEELPRLDDEEKFFFIWKYPRNFMKKSDFEISSVGFFIRFTKIILITDYDFDYFRINKVKFRNNFDIILKFMEFTLKHYSAHLKITKAISKEVQSKIISSMENKYLYPQLKENLKTKNTAESFEKEMEGILEVFLNFKEKYNTSVKIDENINLFKKETLAVLKALEERIAKEEKSLYVL